MTRRGPLPTRLITPAATAETAHAARNTCSVWLLEAAKIGVRRYSTTMPMTDHADCTIADAAVGAVVEVIVTQPLNGHSASRPTTPTNKSTEPSTIERTVHPGFVCRMGSRVARFCVP